MSKGYLNKHLYIYRITILAIGVELMLMPSALYYALLNLYSQGQGQAYLPWRNLIIIGLLIGAYMISYGLGLVSPIFRREVRKHPEPPVSYLDLKEVESETKTLNELLGGVILIVAVLYLFISLPLFFSHEMITHGMFILPVMGAYFLVTGSLMLWLSISLIRSQHGKDR